MKSSRVINMLIVALCLFMLNLMPVKAVEYKDMNRSYWAYDSIQALSKDNILTGYNDQTFRPDLPVTRAEFATMIIKALERDDMQIGQRHNFVDVSPQYWGDKNIQRAYKLDLISGFPDGTFKPGSLITKSQVLAILANTLNTGYLSKSEAENIVASFRDSTRIPEWAVIPVAKTVQADIVVNYPQNNMLMPTEYTSRAEVAAMLYKLRQRLNLDQPGNDDIAQQPGQQPTPQQPQYPSVGDDQPQQTPYDDSVGNVVNETINYTSNNVYLSGYVATIPENSVIPTILKTSLSSELATPGDEVRVSVPQRITAPNGNVLIPAGSRIIGTITTAVPAQRVNRSARLGIDFHTIEYPNGEKYPLKASIATESGMIVSGSAKSQIGKGVLRSIAGAGTGAALGTALGAITGRTGKGAIYGTAIGGGLGVLGSVLARGGEITIPTGETIFLRLDQPLLVDVRNGEIIPQ
jgi:hypothetical protein